MCFFFCFLLLPTVWLLVMQSFPYHQSFLLNVLSYILDIPRLPAMDSFFTLSGVVTPAGNVISPCLLAAIFSPVLTISFCHKSRLKTSRSLLLILNTTNSLYFLLTFKLFSSLHLFITIFNSVFSFLVIPTLTYNTLKIFPFKNATSYYVTKRGGHNVHPWFTLILKLIYVIRNISLVLKLDLYNLIYWVNDCQLPACFVTFVMNSTSTRQRIARCKHLMNTP